MRSINIKSFYEAHQTMNQEQFNSYMEFFRVKVKEHEKSDIANFIENLIDKVKTHFLSGFFIGYKIPQISMEFDLLRIGSNYNLNIEIKNQSDLQTICNQLIKHRYYFGPLNKITHLYSFVSSSGEFYKLEGENIKLTTIDEIVQCIKDQEVIEDPDLNTLFSPGQYLVSPLNSTDKFMENGYFLNNNQQEIKRDIYAWLETIGPSTVSIKGKPGTGKTLLAYDIVKECRKNKKVLVVHSGMLCQGHHTLNEKYNWEIKPIKHLWDTLHSESTYDLILIDEAQRMHEDQLELIYKYISDKSSKIIFAYDPDQILSTSETEVICEKIESSAYNTHHFKLAEKIRTNKEIAAFISNLYNKSSINTSMDYKNVLIQYFSDPDSLRSYLNKLMWEGWEVLNYTGSTYYRLSFDNYQLPAKNAHQIIGQEFDNVAVVINENFYYGPDGRLLATIERGSAGYRPDKMLYQKLTRAREKLIVIIYRNQELLDACLKILSPRRMASTNSLRN